VIVSTDYQPVYDDAELAAVQIIREADAEWNDPKAHSGAMSEHMMAFYMQHGSPGMHHLVIALARAAGALLRVHAQDTGQATTEILDKLELGKIEQHQYDKDNPWDVW
jgi:hypothetical protein